jgi:histone-lysine N-methyltransferase SETMAR
MPGEELTYDYANASGLGGGEEDSKGGDTSLTRCLCGSKNCRGWMPFDPDV